MKADYSKENLEKIVKDSNSVCEVARKLGLKDKGSTLKTIKKYISMYGIDSSHFTGPNWRKGKTQTYVNKLEDILKPNTNYGSSRLLKRLVEEGIKPYECEKCHNSTWMGEELTLELHHIDGDHYNNSLENLQILCPNCHSQTPSYRSRVKSKTPKPERITKMINVERECPECHRIFIGHKSTTVFCSRDCYNRSLKK